MYESVVFYLVFFATSEPQFRVFCANEGSNDRPYPVTQARLRLVSSNHSRSALVCNNDAASPSRYGTRARRCRSFRALETESLLMVLGRFIYSGLKGTFNCHFTSDDTATRNTEVTPPMQSNLFQPKNAAFATSGTRAEVIPTCKPEPVEKCSEGTTSNLRHSNSIDTMYTPIAKRPVERGIAEDTEVAPLELGTPFVVDLLPAAHGYHLWSIKITFLLPSHWFLTNLRIMPNETSREEITPSLLLQVTQPQFLHHQLSPKHFHLHAA